jgi:hypothetical protein
MTLVERIGPYPGVLDRSVNAFAVIQAVKRPFWVKNRPQAANVRCPFFPQQQTFTKATVRHCAKTSVLSSASRGLAAFVSADIRCGLSSSLRWGSWVRMATSPAARLALRSILHLLDASDVTALAQVWAECLTLSSRPGS